MAPVAKVKVPVYYGDAYLPFRKLMRKFFDNIKTEFLVTGLVLINMMLLLVDMIVTEDQCNIYGNSSVIRQCLDDFAEEPFQVQWTKAFSYIELAFLITFAVEIVLRLYAYGFGYFLDYLNAIDAIIVISLLIFQVRSRPRAGDVPQR